MSLRMLFRIRISKVSRYILNHYIHVNIIIYIISDLGLRAAH